MSSGVYIYMSSRVSVQRVSVPGINVLGLDVKWVHVLPLQMYCILVLICTPSPISKILDIP